MRSSLFGLVAVSIWFASAAGAAPPARVPPPAGASAPALASVPEALRPWIPWVMHDHEHELCPERGLWRPLFPRSSPPAVPPPATPPPA